MKILLVQPSRLEDSGKVLKWKRPFHPNLTLSYLAALTPPSHEVEVVDERAETINFDGRYDLVGITALTSHSPRAYELAGEFRKRGSRVVMGGIHASVMSDEAIQHCDSVVIGEADYTWPELLNDCASGTMKQFYNASSLHPLTGLPLPRFDLLKRKDFTSPFTPIQASRGCPHDCDFCSVTRFYGRSYRLRPIEDVIREIKAVGSRRYTFVDDNMAANREYAKELFKALIPLKIRWIGQCSINIGRDPELCSLAAESGCYFMAIGVESIDQNNLQSMDKGWSRTSDYPRLLSTIRQNGIGLVLNMILGLDNDDESSFERILKFLIENKSFHTIVNTLIPYPGTRLAQRMESEGRLLHKDWSRYTQGSVVYSPRRMSPERLKQGFWDLLDKYFSYTSIARRALYQSWDSLPYYFWQNLAFHSTVRRRIY